MILPTIHLNGSNPDNLAAQYLAVAEACARAEEFARQIDFNGRDYYPQGPGAIERAGREFSAHVNMLKTAHEYFQGVALHCADAAATNGGEQH